MKQSMIRAAVAALLMGGVVSVLHAQPAAKGDNPPPAA